MAAIESPSVPAQEIQHGDPKPSALHLDAPSEKLEKIHNRDTALALFAGDDWDGNINPAAERKLVRKIDLMILPFLAVCYAFYYIDKTTLSYAAIFGIVEDLNLQGTQYSWLSSIFYFGFLVCPFPTNFLMQRFPVGKYLGVNIFLWGFFLMLQAAVKNFTQLAVLRAVSGAAEACSNPSFMLITSMWYTRREQPIRIGLWYTTNGFGIALGGLLGYGIGNIKGALASWKYEFLVIGALCAIWGLITVAFLPDSPVTARNLSQEKRLAVERLRDNQTGVENKTLKPYQVWEAVLDWKVWVLFLLGVVANIPNGGISNFGTLIIKGWVFDLSIPYGALISVLILISIWINDRLPPNNRCHVAVLFLLPNVAAAFGLGFLHPDNKVGRLICYYLTGSYNASFVLILSILTANTAGHTKKVVTNAMIFLGVCAGNIAGPFFYKTEQAPTYPLGMWSMIVSHLAEIALLLSLRFLLWRENCRRDRIQGILRDDGQVDADVAAARQRDLDATAFNDLTDKENLNFRYIY